MKKIVLSLAGVMAAVAFAPEASAVPVFARQTGMACSACHFQHFPLLNGFGRAFKSSGFTIMGAQGKVEGEHLSIPATLNLGVLTSTYYQNANATGGLQPKWGVPGSGGEFSLFIGGRISEFAGFLAEEGMSPAGLGAAKLAMLFPIGDSRVGFVPYTGGQGAAYSFELLNTGAADTHKMMGNAGPNKEHVKAAYAGSYIGTRMSANNSTGIQVVAVNPSMGFVTVGKYANVATSVGANTLPLTYVRVAGMFDLGGWDSAVGIQSFSGNQTSLGLANSAKATVVDSQFQGELAGMSTGLYVTYGRAPTDAVNANIMNAGVNTKTSFNVAGSLEIVPGIATVQAAVRRAKNGAALNNSDNAIMLGATYELAQNIEIGLNYTAQSGSAWNGITSGKKATTLLMEALF